MRRVQLGVASPCSWKLSRFQAPLSSYEFQHSIELYLEEIGWELGTLEEVHLPRPSGAHYLSSRRGAALSDCVLYNATTRSPHFCKKNHRPRQLRPPSEAICAKTEISHTGRAGFRHFRSLLRRTVLVNHDV